MPGAALLTVALDRPLAGDAVLLCEIRDKSRPSAFHRERRALPTGTRDATVPFSVAASTADLHSARVAIVSGLDVAFGRCLFAVARSDVGGPPAVAGPDRTIR